MLDSNSVNSAKNPVPVHQEKQKDEYENIYKSATELLAGSGELDGGTGIPVTGPVDTGTGDTQKRRNIRSTSCKCAKYTLGEARCRC